MTTRILFVCLGNICRSPTAEGVFIKLVRDAGLADRFVVDSAGTAAYHQGERADARMREHARKRNYDLTSIARGVVVDDFARFDRIFAMDRSNLGGLTRLAPAAHRHKISLFRDYDTLDAGEDVPDPYYGGPAGFETVLDIAERCGRALLAELAPAGRR